MVGSDRSGRSFSTIVRTSENDRERSFSDQCAVAHATVQLERWVNVRIEPWGEDRRVRLDPKEDLVLAVGIGANVVPCGVGDDRSTAV